MRTYKAFVSSTYIDLKEHRAHVIEALRDAGFQVDPMEKWTAASDEPKRLSRKRVDGCDLCVLLVARRRGHVPKGETKSITQMEYESAVTQGIAVLPFLLDEDAPWYAKFDERRDDPALAEWLSELQERHVWSLFGLGPETIQIFPALLRWMAERRETEGPAIRYWRGLPASLGEGFVGRTDDMGEVDARFQ